MDAENDPRDTYESPLITRYAGAEMASVFSEGRRARTWRRLWIALAEAEKSLGLAIPDAAIAAMRRTADTPDLARARAIERETRHDVVAHIRAWKEQAPEAGPIIHLGATSTFVTDNADLLALKDALRIVRDRILDVVEALAEVAARYADLPCLAYTHLQPAQATTVGKRACLWIQDLLTDLEDVDRLARGLRFHGCKGATGTQASFVELFQGDGEKTRRLDALVATSLGFETTYPVTGQTYPRKEDQRVLQALGLVAASAAKFAGDVRLLQSMGEVLEPAEASQVGSSAMAYKRNPVRCERISSLARFVLFAVQNAAFTASEQWFERTLDDSANRRIVLPEAFLGVDAILRLYADVARGLAVEEERIAARLAAEIPALATEPILMRATLRGGDRQDLHERIRRHARAAAEAARAGTPTDLARRLAADPAFASIRDEIPALCDPRRFVGRAPDQTREFLDGWVRPALARYPDRVRRQDPPEV